eukprot:CAMPEP_0116867508 /NCGR_PEP_ID=MMETSP0418-20121206/26666_1 /TAXON_ID=1158023 /ORGANISM="Astrosyne radiata, Strain 13vi08-1A" /LENGTH=246 /DNA_ID=CAMNT_0004503347 /DNA_START=52 /DNA_END=793 /DNA_ORIENTATION=-
MEDIETGTLEAPLLDPNDEEENNDWMDEENENDDEASTSSTEGACDGTCQERACHGTNVLRDVALAYHVVLERRPLQFTAFFILGGADLVGQAVQAVRSAGGGDELDVLRTLRFAVFGFVLQAPWNHFYYLVLDGALPPTEYPWTGRTFLKVLIDQLIQAPIFTVVMFCFLGLEDGMTLEEIHAQLKAEYLFTMMESYKLWVPATLANFGLVPPLYRVLFLNVVFFVWSVILSLILNPTPVKDGAS